MPASFFEGASNIQISGQPLFQNIVAGRDVHQTNHLGNTYNRDSNNTTTTVIQDSYNNNSRHIVGASAREVEKEVKSTVRSAKARANRRPDPADHEVRSEPDVRSATPPFPSPEGRESSRPTPTHTASAPPPTHASPYLAVPVLQPQSTNTSSTSLTPSVATSPGIPQGSPSLDLHRPASAPHSSTLSSSVGSPLSVSSSQQFSFSVGQVDLSARYRYLVTQSETRFEIRRKLVGVAQSLPKDKFFILKDQATRANSILELIEGSKEKIQSKEEVVRLCLESHAVAFIVIMAAETQVLNDRKIYNLLKTLNSVDELMNNIVHKNGLSRMHPFKKSENEKLIKTYRKELETWLRDFQSDKEATIGFALHRASQALSVALSAEQHYTVTVDGSPAQQPSSASSAPSALNSRPQRPALSPGSTSVSDVSQGAVSTGSGSAAAINAQGSRNNQIHQGSHIDNSITIYR